MTRRAPERSTTTVARKSYDRPGGARRRITRRCATPPKRDVRYGDRADPCIGIPLPRTPVVSLAKGAAWSARRQPGCAGVSVARQVVAAVTKVPERADPIAAELCRLCVQAVSTLPATGAGLSVMTMDIQLSLLAAADPVSERLEELQFVLGEGPCVDAIAAGRPVLVPDLAAAGPAIGWTSPPIPPSSRIMTASSANANACLSSSPES